ncbi:MAG: hypothetical protein J6R29_01710 [Clostridia bacterium]|nr:hypothetical protein [Clostridia bacterium]
MIIYDNKLSVPNYQNTKVTINSFSGGIGSSNDESVKKASDAKVIFNFDIGDGALKAGAGLKEFTVKGKNIVFEDKSVRPIKFYYFKNYDVENNLDKDVLLCYASNGIIYSLNLYDNEPKLEETSMCFSNAPTAVTYNNNGENILLLSSFNDPLCVYSASGVKSVDGAPKFNSMCVHNERVFATENAKSTSLWFSDDFNPLNWYISIDEAGFIDFPDERGALLKVISFLDYVYVFREYGITRLYASGNQEDFSVSNLHSKVGKIFGESVTDCGNHVYFLADTGLYRFNGVDSVKILSCYDNFIKGVDNKDAYGLYFNNKFWLNLKMKIDGKIQNVILVYNLQNDTSYIIKDCKITSLCLFDGQNKELIAVYDNGKKVAKVLENYGKLFEIPLKKVWQGIESDFSLPCKKNLYKISLETNEELEILITCDGVKRYYKLNPHKNFIEPKIKGKNFSISIISYDNAPRIYKPIIYFRYLREHLW